MNHQTIIELAALASLGALDGEEREVFTRLLAENPEARRLAASFSPVVEALSECLPVAPAPPAALRARILQAAENARPAKTKAPASSATPPTRGVLEAALKKLLPPDKGGFAFLKQASDTGWLPLPVPGAFVKLLSYDPANEYATVLGKLERGARYPGHPHIHPEDIFMLSGDLHIGEEVLRAGDFHHAGAGTTHGVNWSEGGCILLAVLSKEDLVHQFAGA